jgi:hypothetical protein
MSKSYVIACLIDIKSKTITVSARDPKQSNCEIIMNNNVESLYINNQYLPVFASNLTRNEARNIKEALLDIWVNKANYKLVSAKVVA